MNDTRPVASKIAQLNAQAAAARANQGFGGMGKWPDPQHTSKEHIVEVVDFTVNWQDTFEDYTRPAGPDGNKPGAEAVTFRFSYVTHTPTGPEEWKGVPKTFAYDANDLSDAPPGKKWGPRQFSLSMLEKVKGDINAILGEGTWGDDITIAAAAIAQRLQDTKASGGRLLVSVYCEWRSREYIDPKTKEKKIGWDRHDYIRGLASGLVANPATKA